jgi:hypothetical protein
MCQCLFDPLLSLESRNPTLFSFVLSFEFGGFLYFIIMGNEDAVEMNGRDLGLFLVVGTGTFWFLWLLILVKGASK